MSDLASTLRVLSPVLWPLVPIAIASYLVGSIPWAYILVKRLTGEDITNHGTGNVGAMNVKRTTGSWTWFAVATLLDGFKGLVPVMAAEAVAALMAGAHPSWSLVLYAPASGIRSTLHGQFDLQMLAGQAALFGAVLGHNYSLWLALLKRRYVRTGKGLATGAGALLGYNPIYFAVVLVMGLGTIAITKYMMAGQVAAALSLPAFSILARQRDWPFALVMGLIVYAAHHKRFVGLLQGKEPRLYTQDGMGPRG